MYNIELLVMIADGIPFYETYEYVNTQLQADLEELQMVHDNLTVTFPPATADHEILYYNTQFNTVELYNDEQQLHQQGFINMVSEHLTQGMLYLPCSHSLVPQLSPGAYRCQCIRVRSALDCNDERNDDSARPASDPVAANQQSRCG